MKNDQEESRNPIEGMGIRKRIRDKFKFIAAETKAIKERIHALAISLSFFSVFPVKEMFFTVNEKSKFLV